MEGEWSLLNELARDIISLLGLLIGLVGFPLTLWQLWITRTAAQAAEEASRKALEESRLAFQKFATAYSHRFINEVKIHLSNEAWELAALRLNDLADHASQLAPEDNEWTGMVDEIRRWSAQCQRLHTKELRRFPNAKWLEFTVSLESLIDGIRGPFAVRPRGELP